MGANMTDPTVLFEISALNAACAAVLDSDRLEEWPGFFFEQCLYKVTTADNHAKGYQAGIIYADTRAMLTDRIFALREANIYERQRYRHILAMPLIQSEADGVVSVETSFPIDLFLLMGDNYIGNDALGRACHAKRKTFELALARAGKSALKQEMYRRLAQLGIGRDVFVVARKPA